MHRIVVFNKLLAAYGKDLTSVLTSDHPFEIVLATPSNTRALARADAVATVLNLRIDRAFLKRVPRVRVVSNCAVGVDNIDLGACRARDIRVTNTPDVLTRATAELTVALLFAAARRLPEGEKLCRQGRFKGWALDMLLGVELQGRHAVIAGAGRIGKETGALFSALGLEVEYITRFDSEGLIQEKLKRAEVLSIHLPLTPETRHWLNRKRIALLPRDAIVINTARGPVMDEKALTDALKNRRIFSAGLDVYENEPRIPTALRRLPNVVLLPHLGSATTRTRREMARLTFQGALDVLNGKHPPNLVG